MGFFCVATANNMVQNGTNQIFTQSTSYFMAVRQGKRAPHGSEIRKEGGRPGNKENSNRK